ncbi:MAG: aspartate kinase, partial [Myxococcota bacterium]
HVLTQAGLPSISVDSREWTVTDDHFGSALVDWPATEARIDSLKPNWRDVVTVHTGFLGRTSDGRATTLGRNGSDYTASLLARGLEAEEMNIWTGTAGVMSADPEIVPEAYPVPALSYMEALELANFGARMFHPRTMIPLISSNIPLRIRNTLVPAAPGTMVSRDGSPSPDNPTSVASLERLALVTVDAKREAGDLRVGERVLSALSKADIKVWTAIQSGFGQAVAVIVPEDQREMARDVIRVELEPELTRNEVDSIELRHPVSLVTLVAEAMGQTVNVAGRLFHALGLAGIGVWSIAQSGSARSIACAVDAKDTREAVRTVHAAFNFSFETVHVMLMGAGVVGGNLLDQIRQQQDSLRESMGIDLKVVGIANSRGVVFDEEGLSLNDWSSRMTAMNDASGEPDVRPLLERLRRLGTPILVDCTAADDMENIYHAAFERGIHVVAANKKALTIAWPDRQRLLQAARVAHRYYNYETTVGASLPVIDTLVAMIRTGDQVRRVEGSLSGTLGYLTNQLMDGVSLSDAVRDAKNKGYTEPHPRDDLSGTDAARKALILARELGVSLEFDDVEVKPLVPPEILAEDNLESFFSSLERYDPVMSAEVEEHQRKKEVLRYLATVEPNVTGGKVLRVGPTWVPSDHPATRLRGTEAFLAFFTERYPEEPLVIQGAGAGGPVTAAGVLADILKIGQSVRGR